MSGSVIMGIETSCDETSAAVVRGDGEILGHVILSQDVHAVYGGVVPELAARAHLRVLDDVVGRTLEEAGMELGDMDAFAVTAGPGLIGALLVGVSWAKAVGWALDRPVLPVHHMEAHLFAPSLEDPAAQPPVIALLVSGGHTLLLHARAWGDYRLLGRTRDDAAGEAFDKVAKLLDLPYPGGPAVERLARIGDAGRELFPRPMLHSGQLPEDVAYYDFSFSGLKTAVATRVAELGGGGGMSDEQRSDLAAGFQQAAVDVLATKTVRAVEETGCRRVLLGGGVSANQALRQEIEARLGDDGKVFVASPRLSLDNGAMVAQAGRFHLAAGATGQLDFAADAGMAFPGLRSMSLV